MVGVQVWVGRGGGGPGGGCIGVVGSSGWVSRGVVRVQGWMGRGWWGSRGGCVGCGRGSGGQGVCGMYGLGINGGVKGALTGIFDPMQGGLSLPILDFDQLADI